MIFKVSSSYRDDLVCLLDEHFDKNSVAFHSDETAKERSRQKFLSFHRMAVVNEIEYW